MANPVVFRIRAVARAAFRLVEDTFSVRLLLAALALRHCALFPFLTLAGFLLGCLMLAAAAGISVFRSLDPGSEWALAATLAALVACLLVLELCAATVMAGVHALLRLSYDTGRHRIGALLAMLALASSGGAAMRIWIGSGLIPQLSSAALLFVLAALWFERVYRRPAFPRFRDFHADVVAARLYLTRTSHGG